MADSLHCGKYRLSLSRPLIVGVVNITPDSFSDGGRFLATEAAVRQSERLVSEGADLLDLGGESSRPGALPVSVDVELDRVLPVLERVLGLGVPVSVDTTKPAVMRTALSMGADMINDINGFLEPGALEAVADSTAAACVMHKQGEPATMQHGPQYQDVVAEVRQFLKHRLDAALAAGIDAGRVVLDPGFGFGKTLGHNLALLRRLNELTALPYPLMVGLSRKSMLGQLTGRAPGDRQAVSAVAALLAAQKGAKLLRVHDVQATKDALALWEAFYGS